MVAALARKRNEMGEANSGALGKKRYCCRQGNRYRNRRDEMAAAYQIMPALYPG